MPKIAVVPSMSQIELAVAEGGGRLTGPPEADGIVWTDPRDPEGLRALLASSPARWVQLPFAGIERFFEAAVLDAGRTWTCAKGVYGPATAEHALALILMAARRLDRHARARHWLRDDHDARRLAGGTVLIVGTGGIGRALAGMLEPLGPRILAVNRSGRPLAGAERTVAVAGLHDVLAEAHWVVVAAPLTPETRHLFDSMTIARMRSEAWLVNVARGGLVDTEALVEAVTERRIAGAALDVTDPEPLPDDHPLWSLDNVVISSHTGNTFAMAIPELRALVALNVARFARGEPLEGLVDVSLGY